MKTINEILNIKEAFELPKRIMEILASPQEFEQVKRELMAQTDPKRDVLRDYFQQIGANRKEFKQDYTPDDICDLIAMLIPKGDALDVCSGSGALTIASADGRSFQCEEYSEMVLPVLLLNLAMREIEATVLKKNVLTREVERVYQVSGGKVELVQEHEEKKFDVIISNPPYSLKWEPQFDERFFGFELPPKSKADYAFVLDIYSRLNEGGRAYVVLPHGVLFRGQAEGEIRKRLVELNAIESIIGLPDSMFLNTSIPVCILILAKRKETDIFFVNASKQCKKEAKINRLLSVPTLARTITERKPVERLARLVTIFEVQQNDYNLNIPRYVDTAEPEPEIHLEDITSRLTSIEQEISACSAELIGQIKSLRGTTVEADAAYQSAVLPLLGLLERRLL